MLENLVDEPGSVPAKDAGKFVGERRRLLPISASPGKSRNRAQRTQKKDVAKVSRKGVKIKTKTGCIHGKVTNAPETEYLHIEPLPLWSYMGSILLFLCAFSRPFRIFGPVLGAGRHAPRVPALTRVFGPGLAPSRLSPRPGHGSYPQNPVCTLP